MKKRKETKKNILERARDGTRREMTNKETNRFYT